MEEYLEEEQRLGHLRDCIGNDTAYGVLKILRDSQEKRYSAGDLEKEFDASLATVYRRLKDLEEAELVEERYPVDDPNGSYYAVSSRGEELAEFIENFYEE